MVEAEIVLAASRGDPAAFKRLVEGHCRAVFELAGSCLHSADDARAVTQETFVTVHQELARLKGIDESWSWLVKIALNECLKWCRRRARLPEPKGRALHEAMAPTVEARLAVTLCHVAEHSKEAIAAVLGCTPDTVKTRLLDARKRLRWRMANGASTGALPHDFPDQVLRAALASAREPDPGDACDAFSESTRAVLAEIRKAATRSSNLGGDLSTLMADAAAAWLSEPDSASELFARAIDLAERTSDRSVRARALEDAYLVQLRRGEFASAKRHADAEARLLYHPEEACARALAHAASALAGLLPGRWKPGDDGGYAFGALLLQRRPTGWRLNRPLGHRNYSWGTPEFSSVYAFLWRFGNIVVDDSDVGRSVTGEVDTSDSYCGWIPEADEPLVVEALVESVTDRIVTPAGAFHNCLRLVFSVKPRDREFATTYVTRTVAGRTLAWFARGVGLVKLTRVDQNEYHARSAYLRRYECSGRGTYFPVSARATWSFTWTSAWDGEEDQGVFEEQVTCFPGQDGTVCMASASVARPLYPIAFGNHWRTILTCERAGDDANGHAEALRRLIRFYAKSSPDSARRLGEELIDLWERHNDPWNALNARETVERLDAGAGRAVRLVHERLRFARIHRHRRRAAECLVTMARDCRTEGRLTEANGFAQEAARAYESLGDVDRLTWARSLIEVIRQSRDPRTSGAPFRIEGTWEIEHCSGVLRPSHSVRMWVPPREGSPIHDLASSGCALALDVLSRPVGERTHSWDHVALLDGGWEHVRATRWLKAESETVTVVAGTFTDCRLVEVAIRAGTEPAGSSRSALRGYIGAAIRVWFAPGVGCVRVTHDHDNGTTTDLQLTSFHVEPTGTGSPFPLMVGNRWVYRWTDELTGAKFEDTVLVAAQRNARWHLAFVTVGVPGATSKVLPSRAMLLYRTQGHADCR
jgi:RNA polymerase sigma-70 factor (ECF subfamily)